MTNQYALGYKAGLKEAELEARGYHLACNAADGIASLPVPEVQWRDLTDGEIKDVIRFKVEGVTVSEMVMFRHIAESVIAKFKEKQL